MWDDEIWEDPRRRTRHERRQTRQGEGETRDEEKDQRSEDGRTARQGIRDGMTTDERWQTR